MYTIYFHAFHFPPRLLIDPLLPLPHPFNFMFFCLSLYPLLKTWSPTCVVRLLLSIEPSLEFGQYTKCYSIEWNWLFITHHQSNTNSSLVRCGTPLLSSGLKFCLPWVCACFLCPVSVFIWVHMCILYTEITVSLNLSITSGSNTFLLLCPTTIPKSWKYRMQ